MLRNVTITLSEEAAQWARKKAAEENTSVSRLVGRLLEDQMRASDEYWKAYRRVKRVRHLRLHAAGRLSRDEAHGRS